MPLPLILVGVGVTALATAAIGATGYARKYTYRTDEGLDFLEHVSSEDLNLLVEFLTKRTNEELSECQAYKAYYPNHSKYWREIATEIQTFGGHTVSNIYRGEGAPYREILYDVCDRLKVKYDRASSVQTIELNLLVKTLADTVERLEPTDRVELLQDLGLDKASARSFASTGSVGSQIVLSLLRSRGFIPYKWAVKLVHITIGEAIKLITGKGLPFVTSQIVTKGTQLLLGPVGMALSAAWTVYDVHGPAYRVTVPSVLYIAMLRQKQLQE